MAQDCIFCRIIAGEVSAYTVYEDAEVVAFLDTGPLFAGHTLVCPRTHYDTLPDVPASGLAPLFCAVQLVSRAVEEGLGAAGSFVAVNNKISQSVPHLHVHVIPRRKGDGMKGFFWPRRPYRDETEAREAQGKLRTAIARLLPEQTR